MKGPHELKEHPWFKDYNWSNLLKKNFEAPFIPKIGDNFDKKYCESVDKIGIDTKERYEAYIKADNYKEAFLNFTYFNNNTTVQNSRSIIKTQINNASKSKTILNILNKSNSTLSVNLSKIKNTESVKGSNTSRIQNSNYSNNYINNKLSSSKSSIDILKAASTSRERIKVEKQKPQQKNISIVNSLSYNTLIHKTPIKNVLNIHHKSNSLCNPDNSKKIKIIDKGFLGSYKANIEQKMLNSNNPLISFKNYKLSSASQNSTGSSIGSYKKAFKY